MERKWREETKGERKRGRKKGLDGEKGEGCEERMCEGNKKRIKEGGKRERGRREGVKIEKRGDW